MQGNWGTMGPILVGLIIGMFALLAFLGVFIIISVRMMTKDKIACTFHKNHKKGGALLKYDPVNQCVWLGKEDDPNREKYMVTEDEIEWIEFPGMLPHFMNVTIRSLDYVRGVPTPMHPEKKVNANISAKSLRLQSDGNVLQAVYLHAKQSLNLGKKGATSMLILGLLLAAIGISLFGTYKSMQASTDVGAVKYQIQSMMDYLGMNTTAPAPTFPPPPTSTTIPTIGGK